MTEHSTIVRDEVRPVPDEIISNLPKFSNKEVAKLFMLDLGEDFSLNVPFNNSSPHILQLRKGEQTFWVHLTMARKNGGDNYRNGFRFTLPFATKKDPITKKYLIGKDNNRVPANPFSELVMDGILPLPVTLYLPLDKNLCWDLDKRVWVCGDVEFSRTIASLPNAKSFSVDFETLKEGITSEGVLLDQTNKFRICNKENIRFFFKREEVIKRLVSDSCSYEILQIMKKQRKENIERINIRGQQLLQKTMTPSLTIDPITGKMEPDNLRERCHIIAKSEILKMDDLSSEEKVQQISDTENVLFLHSATHRLFDNAIVTFDWKTGNSIWTENKSKLERYREDIKETLRYYNKYRKHSLSLHSETLSKTKKKALKKHNKWFRSAQ